eukprot:TRINITY_DN18201_c0_g1_i1.p1 TRINITY_DN18201_c0_g1~~TRINITY_DN18201_c0_g1_i1.p1  ORF type:complete len:103 (-),score=3.86 TRINITY_DN18201_c0_g1_i1:419-727(-)
MKQLVWCYLVFLLAVARIECQSTKNQETSTPSPPTVPPTASPSSPQPPTAPHEVNVALWIGVGGVSLVCAVIAIIILVKWSFFRKKKPKQEFEEEFPETYST